MKTSRRFVASSNRYSRYGWIIWIYLQRVGVDHAPGPDEPRRVLPAQKTPGITEEVAHIEPSLRLIETELSTDLAHPVPSGQKGSSRLSPATASSSGNPFLTDIVDIVCVDIIDVIDVIDDR